MERQIVTCSSCISRRALIAAAGKHAIRASELYRVGEIQGVDAAGHQRFFTVYGVMTLCAAEELQPPTYYRDRRAG